jgi:hypothetical protein
MAGKRSDPAAKTSVGSAVDQLLEIFDPLSERFAIACMASMSRQLQLSRRSGIKSQK